MELFEDIPGYEGIYQVSNLGRVKSFKKYPSGEILRQYKHKKGYMTVDLKKKGKTKLVHRFVSMAFIPNPEKKPCVNHKNGIKTDNRADNLEWCTYSENHKHAFKNGLMVGRKLNADNYPGAKLNKFQVKRIRLIKEVTPGITQLEISNMFPIGRRQVSHILSRGKWINT